MFWEMMRGIYKKLFAEFFPRNLPMEDFAVPSRRLAVSEMAMPFLRSMSFISSSPAQSLTFMLKYINVYEEKNAKET